VILSVGRLSKEKDHLTLLNAVRGLPGDLRPRVLIVGEGPERASIESAVKQLGLKHSVMLTGHQESVAPYYAIADVLAISSRSEGSPNVLLEGWLPVYPW